MTDFLPCSPSTLGVVCCLQSIPNTSEWQTICPREPQAAQSIPTVSSLGLVICAVMVGTAAVRLIRA